MKIYTLIFLIAISTYTAAQNPGTLNPVFSGNGWDSIFGNNNGFEITKILMQADEKILVCAEGTFSSEAHQAIIVRYTPDGFPDATFGGGDGMVRSREDENINLFTRAYGMALQSTGKIIVAGDQLYNSERIFRLNQDGTLDGSFGTNGVIDLERPNAEFIYHVAVQSDDKVIVCGREMRLVAGVLEPHVFLWRFTADGERDFSFGDAGVVSYNSSTWLGGFESYLVINDLIVLPDDAILVNQTFTVYPYNYVMLSKLNANGTHDASFGAGGHFLKSVKSNDGNYTYSSSAVQENGSVISTLTTRDTLNLTYTETIFRVDALGQPDPSLSLEAADPEYQIVRSELHVAGNLFYHYRKSDYNTAYSHVAIRCYDLNGSPLTGFGSGGLAIIDQNDIPVSSFGSMVVGENGDLFISSGIPDPVNFSNALFLTSRIKGASNNVSVNNHQFTNSFTVYPNPSSGLCYLRSSSDTSGGFTVEVKNSLGQTVISEPHFKTDEAINLSNMPVGMYIIKISNQRNVEFFKVLKQ